VIPTRQHNAMNRHDDHAFLVQNTWDLYGGEICVTVGSCHCINRRNTSRNTTKEATNYKTKRDEFECEYRTKGDEFHAIAERRETSLDKNTGRRGTSLMRLQLEEGRD
jgi:hypothetical protein